MEMKTEMKTDWYLKPGQTLQNTKIEDRGHALLVTKKGFSNVTKHLDRKRLIQEAIEQNEARKLALKQGSQNMTKYWSNSVENNQIQKEQARIARIKKDRDEKMERFYRLRAEQAEIREKIIKDSKRNMYVSKGPPKDLTGALLLSEVLYERGKQHELDQMIKEYNRNEEVKYAQKVKEGVEQEKKEKQEEQEKIRKKGLEIKDTYIKAMRDNEENLRKMREEKIKREQLDIVNMKRENERIKQIEVEEERKRRVSVKKEFNDFLAKQQEIKEQLEQEEKEQNIVINIFSLAKDRIECLRKKKVEDMQKALQARREAASAQAVAEAKTKSGNEERLLREAQKNVELEELEKLKAKAAYKEKLTRDRYADREAFLKREAQQNFEKEEVKKWDMLNRFKSDAVIKEYIIDKKNKLWQETLQYRKALLDQMAQTENEKGRSKDIAEAEYRETLAKRVEEDGKFFDYATEVYEHAKNRGRRTSPIRRVIEEYKKTNNLPRDIIRICENRDVTNAKD